MTNNHNQIKSLKKTSPTIFIELCQTLLENIGQNQKLYNKIKRMLEVSTAKKFIRESYASGPTNFVWALWMKKFSPTTFPAFCNLFFFPALQRIVENILNSKLLDLDFQRVMQVVQQTLYKPFQWKYSKLVGYSRTFRKKNSKFKRFHG